MTKLLRWNSMSDRSEWNWYFPAAVFCYQRIRHRIAADIWGGGLCPSEEGTSSSGNFLLLLYRECLLKIHCKPARSLLSMIWGCCFLSGSQQVFRIMLNKGWVTIIISAGEEAWRSWFVNASDFINGILALLMLKATKVLSESVGSLNVILSPVFV